jgi:hypothetical protein
MDEGDENGDENKFGVDEGEEDSEARRAKT